MKKREELIKKYIDFFKSRGHKEIRNASLIPENDPTVLFTTAGMHPLVPYLLGQKHPQGKRLVNVQKCIRTGDIDEVGDNCHHTFFEMLGNWSLGDYFKKEAIEFSFEFLTDVLKIPIEKLEVSCFKGDDNAPKDNEAANIWKNLGIRKIRFLGKKDNWWGPAGATGPCGPDSEMFYEGMEIWNDVFMEYNKTKEGKYVELKQKNVDTGMGVERVVTLLNGFDDNYLTGIWQPIIKKIEKLSGKKYKGNERVMRIIADHVKASCMILNEKIVPGNSEQGYVLRRLIRRAVRFAHDLGIKSIVEISEPVFEIYSDTGQKSNHTLKSVASSRLDFSPVPPNPKYKSEGFRGYKLDKKFIKDELGKEEEKFLKTLEQGIRVFDKMIKGKKLNCKDAFLLYQSYGFPIEMTEDLAEERGIKVDRKGFEKECSLHQEKSRTASEGRFKSGLADDSEATKKLHTATHLLNEALRRVLGKGVSQRGSNITPERLRFDFNFDRKLTDEEIKKVEDLVNKQIKAGEDVVRLEMSVDEAKKAGAQGVFDDKYGEKVSVYGVCDFSKEICAGPHVQNTGELGKFRIVKEESSSAGVRRIKGVLE